MEIPNCPQILPDELNEPLRRFACSWATSRLRPHPTMDVLEHWHTLITSWAETEDMPLFIRKMSEGRGNFLEHYSGRTLVPVDNSPAHWVFYQALTGKTSSLDDIRTSLAHDEIPVAMILKRDEKTVAKLTCTRTVSNNLNKLGWKVAHIESVGINDRGAIISTQMQFLKSHFLRFMSPANMFLIPLELAGIAEIPVVIEEIRRFNVELGRRGIDLHH